MTSGATGAGQSSGITAGVISDPRQADGIQSANDVQDRPSKEDEQKERSAVEKKWKEYDKAREFDSNFRKQVAIDRRYAAGTSDLSWAVTTNLIGAFIDILVALLYARNPDVSVRKAAQVDNSNTRIPMEIFARTLEIIISKLWLKGALKKAARKTVRSVLSTGEGWLKCTMRSDKKPQPEIERAINDAQETLARIEAQQKLLEDPDGKDPEALEAEREEKAALIKELQEKTELAVEKMFAIDFVPSQNIQVSTDVMNVEDYLDADWVGNEIYVLKDDALSRFPRLSTEDIKQAKNYYQTAPRERTTRDIDNVLPQGMLTAESAQAFTTTTSEAESPAFVRVVEIWDRTDKQIRTMIDGVKKWAKEAYAPPYPTERFYPYFYYAFYEVDGERHAQSLAWRLYKLQDEFSSCRSNFRLARERGISNILFNATAIDDAEAKKISDGKIQEFIAVKPSDPAMSLSDIFIAKPVATIDMRLFDPTLILNDMEKISGVQEALQAGQQAVGNPITATEANIQQSGTQARTTSNRDYLEGMLTDLANYTAQQAIQCLTGQDAQKYAGDKAYWPHGMAIEDLFQLIEIDIEAGSTGKPRQATELQAWGTLLPMIQKTIMEIEQALGTGNLALANANIELVKETMLRLGDESDPERFIPRLPPKGSPGAGAPPPPVVPNVTVALKGQLSPEAAAALVQPAITRDAASAPPPAPPEPPPGGAPTPPQPAIPLGAAGGPPPGAGP
jgi:hypothetical protein